MEINIITSVALLQVDQPMNIQVLGCLWYYYSILITFKLVVLTIYLIWTSLAS